VPCKPTPRPTSCSTSFARMGSRRPAGLSSPGIERRSSSCSAKTVSRLWRRSIHPRCNRRSTTSKHTACARSGQRSRCSSRPLPAVRARLQPQSTRAAYKRPPRPRSACRGRCRRTTRRQRRRCLVRCRRTTRLHRARCHVRCRRTTRRKPSRRSRRLACLAPCPLTTRPRRASRTSALPKKHRRRLRIQRRGSRASAQAEPPFPIRCRASSRCGSTALPPRRATGAPSPPPAPPKRASSSGVSCSRSRRPLLCFGAKASPGSRPNHEEERPAAAAGLSGLSGGDGVRMGFAQASRPERLASC
jgi:hypothetical protein